MQDNLKKGVMTSEFWLVVVGAAITIANDGLGLGLDRETIMNFAIMIGGYAASRGIAKMNK